MATAATGDAWTTLAEQFVRLYGRGGVVDATRAQEFLSSLRMDLEFLQTAASRGSCPGHGLGSGVWTVADNATQLLQLLWHRLQTPDCYGIDQLWQEQQQQQQQQQQLSVFHSRERNSAIHVWGFGLLFVTLINLCSMLGAVLLPFIGGRSYKLMMAFMVSLGVSSLVTSALLMLLPESLQLLFFHEAVNKRNSSLVGHHAFHGPTADVGWSDFLSAHPWYIWRCCTALCGLYGFFLMERALKEIIICFRPSTAGNGAAHGATVEIGHSHGVPTMDEKPTESLSAVRPVAWMIIFGDGLHKLIDGVGIGASFVQSTSSGISISIAVLCHELPHELGDFAILLAAGMSVKSALLFNLLSTSFCYVGFVIGVILGESPGASLWIFAIAAGMFLYISLVDMMPEMNSMVDQAEGQRLSRMQVFCLQNLGLLIGFGILLLLALYGEKIDFD